MPLNSHVKVFVHSGALCVCGVHSAIANFCIFPLKQIFLLNPAGQFGGKVITQPPGGRSNINLFG
jgi:hypothetical protein